jgi:hypothetical protein
MGANVFGTTAFGKTAKDAFRNAKNAARADMDEEDDDGYTGTVLEKESFVMIDVPKGVDPYEYAAKLIDKDDPRIYEKWGPAGCVQVGPDTWHFFGWASS